MFSFESHQTPSAKCYFSHGPLPRYIEAAQLPSKKKPFSATLSQPFSHTVNLVLPEQLYDSVWQQIEGTVQSVAYYRVIMKLSELLEGDFFNKYIKSGNIAMLSEGRPGIDNLYSLQDGILRLELPKEIYERVGIVGQPVRDGGRKHIKTRYRIEINLRLPSMVHGRKAFEKMSWAFKNVLNNSLTWLFHDFNPAQESEHSPPSSPPPIAKHHPITLLAQPQSTHIPAIIPPIHTFHPTSSNATTFDSDAMDILEWLDLLTLLSPRIQPGDSIDPFLSRYQVPRMERATTGSMVRVQWQGFLPGTWVRSLFLACLHATRSSPETWFTLSSYALQTVAIDAPDGYTILRLPRRAAAAVGTAEEGAEDGVVVVDKDKVEERDDRPNEYFLWEMVSGFKV